MRPAPENAAPKNVAPENAAPQGAAALLRAELLQPVPEPVAALAATIVAEHGDTVAAVLFYGSCLRDRTADGILDLYVLVDDYRRYHRAWLPALLNRLLPPTVSLLEGPDGSRAKAAVISRRQFARRMRPESLDVTLWARFCQPAALAHARDAAAADWAVETLAQAAATAALWAVRLGPAEATPGEYWVGLFQHTYRAELRPEQPGRARAVYDAAPARFDRLLAAGLARAGATVEAAGDGRLSVVAPGRRRPWLPRRAAGKLLAAARLAKAAFTFANGADYVVWKIERHTGERVELAPWQRRHPLLAAPLILWRLWRRGVIR